MRQTIFPPGWDQQRVKRVLDHYESQTEEEALNHRIYRSGCV